MTTHCCYWIYGEDCVDPRLHGYVGVTKNEVSRVKTHLGRFAAVGHTILLRGTLEECRQLEHSLRPVANIGWNLSPGGQKGPGWKPESIAKMRASKMGHEVSAETRLKLRLANLGRCHSEETKVKIAAVWTGRRHKDETRRLISQSLTGRVRSEEHCRNMSKAARRRKRQPHSLETREKMSQSHLGHDYEERRARHMEALKWRRNRPLVSAAARQQRLRHPPDTLIETHFFTL